VAEKSRLPGAVWLMALLAAIAVMAALFLGRW
jgi:hypothetical protein